jgi:endonuclease/exonuclease/phosphatase family metal-dependent hydrolase
VAEPATTARVMTWNVWWRFGPRWRDRQAGLLRTIRNVDADVIALQESWRTPSAAQAGEFARALGFHHAFAAPSLPPAPDPPEHPDQAGVEVGLGLLSRWPLAAVRQLPLPARHRPQAPVALLATLAHPTGPLHVVTACLEWEPTYNQDRVAQAHALVDLATDPDLDGPAPIVVLGDLNAAPDSPILRPLREVLTDAWAAAGGDPAAVSLRSDHPFAPLEAHELIDQRIDHIFFRPGQPGQHVAAASPHLAGTPVDGLDPSDHLAVVCDLTWSNRPKR